MTVGQGYAIILVNNDKAYKYIYIAPKSEFPLYREVVNLMINSSILALPPNKNPQANQIGLEVGNIPSDITFNPITNLLYVAEHGSNIVSVIDPKTNRILTNITVGSHQGIGLIIQ